MKRLEYLVVIALARCDSVYGEGEAEGEPVEATLQSIHENVFRASCTFTSSCHNQRSADGNLVLGCAIDPDRNGDFERAPTSQATMSLACWNLSGISADNSLEAEAVRLVPGDAAASFLVRKLEGRDLALGSEDNCPMPSTTGCDQSARLSDQTIGAVRKWIDAGAPGCDERPKTVDGNWVAYCEAL